MKKYLLALLLAAVFLTACGQTASSSAPQKDPYEWLLFPKELEFGMTYNDTVEELNRVGLFSDKSSNILIYPAMDLESENMELGHYCRISCLEYSFDDPHTQEFEDERTLRELKISVSDRIKHDRRTKEKHGDSKAEYQVVVDYLISVYGEPIRDTEYGLEHRSTYWDLKEEQMGIEMRLDGVSSAWEDGKFFIRYFSTVDYYDDWYDR